MFQALLVNDDIIHIDADSIGAGENVFFFYKKGVQVAMYSKDVLRLVAIPGFHIEAEIRAPGYKVVMDA